MPQIPPGSPGGIFLPPPGGKNPLLGEGGPGEARDGCGAVRTRTRCRPSSGPGGRTVHPGLLWPSGCISLIRHGLCPCHLPRRGRLPPAGTAREENPLLGEGGSAKPRRVWGGTNPDLVPPLFRLWGGVPFIRGYCGRQVVSPHPSGPEALPPSP